ncbi:hypothetical protein V8C42DRAFT_152834 [Trichoderma barbatum]
MEIHENEVLYSFIVSPVLLRYMSLNPAQHVLLPSNYVIYSTLQKRWGANHPSPLISNPMCSNRIFSVLSPILSIRCHLYPSRAYETHPESHTFTQLTRIRCKSGWLFCPVEAPNCATAQGTYFLDTTDIICESKTQKLPRYPLRVCKIKKYNYARQFCSIHLMKSDTSGLKRPKKIQIPSSLVHHNTVGEEIIKGKRNRQSNTSSILHCNGVEMTAHILQGLVSMQGISEIPERIGRTVTWSGLPPQQPPDFIISIMTNEAR